MSTPKSTYFRCAAKYDDRSCVRKVCVRGAICGFCMYDDNFGMELRKSCKDRQEAWKALVQCYRNDKAIVTDLQAAQQPQTEKGLEKEA
jgi:hypothetical protein